MRLDACASPIQTARLGRRAVLQSCGVRGPASGGLAPDLSDQTAGRIAFRKRDTHDTSPACFDNVSPDNGPLGPIRAFDEHVWLKRLHNRVRRVLIEDDRRIDALECRQHFCSFDVVVQRTLRSLLERPCRSIGIHRNDQRIAKPACLREVAKVAGMQ